MKLTTLLLIASLGLAQAPDTVSERSRDRIVKTARKEILALPFYGAFDWVTCHVNGSTVTLNGATVRSEIRSGAEAVVRKIAGVRTIVNNIDVLPLSYVDDETRYYVYNAIMPRARITRFAIPGPNVPIHVVVKNGHVTLEGFVGQPAGRRRAALVARRVPGVFSVKNNLRVEASVAKALLTDSGVPAQE